MKDSIDLISRRKFIAQIVGAISSLALLPHKIARAGMAFMNMGMMWKRPSYKLWSWGRNTTYMTLGVGDGTDRSSPVQVGAFNDWVQITVGGDSTAFGIRANSTLWGWGKGTSLGNGAVASTSTPVQIGTLANWSQVSSGLSHNLAINSGAIYAWGTNSNGQLGDGTTTVRSSPVQVGSATNWAQVSAGGLFSAAVKKDGTLWTWGSATSGNLGNGLYTSGSYSRPRLLAQGSNYVTLGCCNGMSFFLGSDYKLWVCGAAGPGTGTGNTATTYSSPVQVGAAVWSSMSVGNHNCLAIQTDGSLWGWGYGNFGALGLGDTANRSTPVQVGALTSWAQVYNAASYSSTTTGELSGYGTLTNGTFWAWGYNTYGQLGFGDTVNRSSPVQLGAGTNWLNSKVSSGINTTLVIRSDGSLWGWGNNVYGILGLGDAVSRSSPVQLGALTSWSDICHANNVSLGVQTNGTLWAWGYGNGASTGAGALGLGDTVSRSTPVQVGALTNWSKVRTYNGHVFAIKNDRTLWAWGGPGSTFPYLDSYCPYSSPVQVGSSTAWSSIATGGDHAIGLQTDGSVWAWGYNNTGAIGFNTSSSNCSTPVQVGTSTDWKTVTAGPNACFAVKTDGSLWLWGNNGGDYSLGLGDSYDRYSPVQLGSSRWKTVTAASYANNTYTSVMGIQTDGSLWGWGYTDVYQLGFGLPNAASTPIQVGSSTAWSSVVLGEVNNQSDTNGYTETRPHALALMTDGTLWCWGYDITGQGGTGFTSSNRTTTQVGTTTNWVMVAAGSGTSLALTK